MNALSILFEVQGRNVTIIEANERIVLIIRSLRAQRQDHLKSTDVMSILLVIQRLYYYLKSTNAMSILFEALAHIVYTII